MSTNGSDFAFPLNDSAIVVIESGHPYPDKYKGMTKREYFAAKALQGLLANADTTGSETEYADVAILSADKLILRLNELDEKTNQNHR